MRDDSSSLILETFIEFIVSKNLIEKSCIEMTIDDCVGTYIVNTIKQFYDEYENHKIWLDNKTAEKFELDNFVEVIDAYISGFNALKSEEIIRFLIDLKRNIDELDKNMKDASQLVHSEIVAHRSEPKIDQCDENTKKVDPVDPKIKLLSEMFPEVKIQRVKDVYKQAGKDYERAIELLLNENDGSSIACKDEESGDFEKLSEEEKKILKERTIQKFGFVAVNEDGSIKAAAPPVPQWSSEKKLVRYFDSKVVSTKGEKYFEVKTEEDEELAKQMKKTYVNLKPAKAYRFH